jgi:hypothetical protein
MAGDMMVTDPAIADWVTERAAWLLTLKVAAAAGALLVVALGLSLAHRAAGGTPEAP